MTHKTKHAGMQHHKCKQGLREEATSCTGRKEKATDPGQGTRKPTPTHIPFPTRFSKRRHARRLNRALVVHTPLRIKWQQPRQIMPPITRIYEASVALSSRLSDLGSWKPAAMNRGWDRINLSSNCCQGYTQQGPICKKNVAAVSGPVLLLT